MSTTKPELIKSVSGYLLEGLKKGIEAEANRIYEQYKADMIKELENSKAEMITKLVITLFEHVRINDFGTTITIEVENRK